MALIKKDAMRFVVGDRLYTLLLTDNKNTETGYAVKVDGEMTYVASVKETKKSLSVKEAYNEDTAHQIFIKMDGKLIPVGIREDIIRRIPSVEVSFEGGNSGGFASDAVVEHRGTMYSLKPLDTVPEFYIQPIEGEKYKFSDNIVYAFESFGLDHDDSVPVMDVIPYKMVEDFQTNGNIYLAFQGLGLDYFSEDPVFISINTNSITDNWKTDENIYLAFQGLGLDYFSEDAIFISLNTNTLNEEWNTDKRIYLAHGGLGLDYFKNDLVFEEIRTTKPEDYNTTDITTAFTGLGLVWAQVEEEGE